MRVFVRYLVLGLGIVVLASMVVKHVQFDAGRKIAKALSERATLLEAANAAAELEEMDLDSIQMTDSVRYVFPFPTTPFLCSGAKNRPCVLDCRYAGTA